MKKDDIGCIMRLVQLSALQRSQLPTMHAKATMGEASQTPLRDEDFHLFDESERPAKQIESTETTNKLTETSHSREEKKELV